MAAHDTATTGLSDQEAADRLAVDGPNELPRPDSRGFWRICGEVLREPMFALLLAGGGIYLVIGALKDAAVLLAFAIVSVGIAIVQELRSEHVLEALRDLSSPTALVIRAGQRRKIPARELVRGDLMVLTEGDRIPADGVLLEASDLKADESLLSGESAPVDKVATPSPGPLVRPGGEHTASVYAGSLLVRGTGVAHVAATGGHTEMGRIGRTLESISPDAGRLTLQTRKLVRNMGLLAGLVCASVVLILGLRGGAWLQGLLGGVAVGMAMIPEEFPLVLTVFMVMGAWRISRAGVLTRKATAIETLGSATVLCTDKTGTLTENRMTVVGGWKGGRFLDAHRDGAASEDLATLVRLGVLASAADPFDPMERAFLTAAEQPAPTDWSLIQVYGLRPELLAVTQVWGHAGRPERMVAAKGAPEAIIGLCRLDPGARAQVMRAVEGLAARGMRVLGIAQGRLNAATALPASPTALSLEFAGLVGLADPVRRDVPDAVAACQAAGIRVVMITGDYPATAKAIAAQAGILAGGLMSGTELAVLDDESLKAKIGSIAVFARILPEQKLRIVRALKASGEIVAMTGDGVNDAPALKAADIGVAMGQRGSDVAREAASLVLIKDGFGAIVHTVRLGRRIYENLQHSMSFILAVHLPIAGLAVIPLLSGDGLLLGPVHIAFLEMFVDPVCAIAFEAEPEDPQAMRRPPRDPTEKLFSGRALWVALARGVSALIAVLAVYGFTHWLYGPTPTARAITFTALAFINVALVLASRMSEAGLRQSFLRPNPLLWIMIGALAVLLGLVLFTPTGEAIFDFGPIDGIGALIALAAGLSVLSVGAAIGKIGAGRRQPSAYPAAA